MCSPEATRTQLRFNTELWPVKLKPGVKLLLPPVHWVPLIVLNILLLPVRHLH